MRNERGKRDAEGNCTWRAAIGSHLSPRTALLYPGSHACVPNTLSYSLHTRLPCTACMWMHTFSPGPRCSCRVMNHHRPPLCLLRLLPLRRRSVAVAGPGRVGYRNKVEGVRKVLHAGGGEERTDDIVVHIILLYGPCEGRWGRQPGIAAVAHG